MATPVLCTQIKDGARPTGLVNSMTVWWPTRLAVHVVVETSASIRSCQVEVPSRIALVLAVLRMCQQQRTGVLSMVKALLTKGS